jgi:hypothetical protein
MQRRLVIVGACGVVVGAVIVLAAGGLRASSKETTAVPMAASAPQPIAHTVAAPAPAQRQANEPVHIEIRNVDLQLEGGLSLAVQRMQGLLESTTPGQEPVFDDPNSFVIKAQSADVRMSLATLDRIMNERVFDYEGADVEKMHSQVKDGKLEQRGKLDKAVNIPFKVKGDLSVTDDGRIRFHGQSTKALGIPMKRLMKLFSIEMDDMVKVKPGRGVEVVDNDFIIDPSQILPPPHILGRVTKVALEGDALVLHMGGDEVKRTYEAPISPNHVYFHGGRIRFGKLSMHGADLELIDGDPRDPFKFSLPRYNEQLVAGYSKNTTDHGLRVYMPDIDALRTAPKLAGGPAVAAALPR